MRILNRSYFLRFLAPDTDAGSGGGAAQAVLEGPIPPAATPSTDGIDVLNYEPPTDADIASFIDGGRETMPEGTVTEPPKPEENKPVETPKPEDQKKPEEKPKDQKPGKEPPVAQLRNRLKELEEESTNLKQQLEAAKSDKRVEELSRKIEENEAAIKAKEEAVAAAERKLLVHNPLIAKEVKALSEKFNADIAAATDIVPALQTDLQGLVQKFQSLPRGSAEYADALREFRQELRDRYEDDANTVFDAVRRGHAFLQEHAQLTQKVQQDAESMIFEEQRKAWKTDFDRVETEYSKYFEPPADAATNDPLNTRLFIKRFESEAMPKEEVTRLDSAIKSFIQNVTAGAQPRTKDDFPGMSEEQIQQELGRIQSRVASDRQKLPEVLAVSMKLAAYVRPLMVRLSQLEERLATKNTAQPPNPTQKDGVRQASGSELDELEMPSPDEIGKRVGY